MIKSQKYWIAPDGDVVVVGRCHIATVIEQPERFRLTRETLLAEYHRFGEPLGLEGKARMAILIKLFGSGWVRVRHHPVSDVWAFHLAPTQWDTVRAAIKSFVSSAVEAGIAGRWADVSFLLTDPDGTTQILSSADFTVGGTLPEKYTRLGELVALKTIKPSDPGGQDGFDE